MPLIARNVTSCLDIPPHSVGSAEGARLFFGSPTRPVTCSSESGDLVYVGFLMRCHMNTAHPPCLSGCEGNKDSATVNSCSSRALNSFYVVPAAYAGYGTVQHRFLLPFFQKTCVRRDNYYSSFIPYRLHLAHHMKDQSPAHFFLPWHLVLQAWMLQRKLQIPRSNSVMHTLFSACVISPCLEVDGAFAHGVCGP